ncbi:dipeptidase PepE [Algivirga pacifica]|uniref:Dipeptidase PepE n=1 Tax=Algivirga pacifica TaxID=1162670 RepID=A0ABP9D374_9BACT
MSTRKLMVVSTSTVYGKGYLEYCQEDVKDFFKEASTVIFIPFARPGGISHDEYTAIAREKFTSLGITLKGVHEFDDPVKAIEEAQGVFTGGGNTFVLLKQLYDQGVLLPLRKRITEGMPYMGTSAGSNITGLTISTTNDMPIVYPPSFEALQVLPFNINPHYLDPNPDSKHMGETRETRIKEFHYFNEQAVVGLREGSWLLVDGDQITLKGTLPVRMFEKGKDPYELPADADLSFLLS